MFLLIDEDISTTLSIKLQIRDLGDVITITVSYT